jgi:hypothetical protein
MRIHLPYLIVITPIHYLAKSLKLNRLIPGNHKLWLGVMLGLLFFSSNLSFAEQTEKLPPAMGVHGMLLFGNESALFASHLPMYHPPHNAQVILKLKFTDPQTQSKVQSALTMYDTKQVALWTLVPRPFDLARLAVDHPQRITQLLVDVFEGHFERRGNLKWQKVRVNIEEVILFSPLGFAENKTKPTAGALSYLLLRQHENDPVQFAIKRLGMRPEADHLLRLTGINHKLPSEISLPLTGRKFATHKMLAQTLSSIESLGLQQNPLHFLPQNALQGGTSTIQAETLYLELNELK